MGARDVAAAIMAPEQQARGQPPEVGLTNCFSSSGIGSVPAREFARLFGFSLLDGAETARVYESERSPERKPTNTIGTSGGRRRLLLLWFRCGKACHPAWHRREVSRRFLHNRVLGMR